MSDPANPPANPPAPMPPEPQTFTREFVSELRHENAAWRVKAQESTTKAQAAEASLALAETAANEKIATAARSADERILRAEMKSAAIKAGMVDLDGLKLADLSKVKLNADGEVEGAEELMTELKKSKPYLFGTASTSSTGPAPKPAPTTQKKASEMTPQEYAKARADVRAGRVPQYTA